MNRVEFRQRLAEKPLLLDGAMGTLLMGAHQDFHHVNTLNVEKPAIVAEIHRQYIEAGADIIETNTFDANRYKLGEHGLAEHVVGINQSGVQVARRVIEASFKPVLLAGSVGPLGINLEPLGRVSREAAGVAFEEQMVALVAAGVDLLVLETMSNLGELRVAIQAARSVAPEMPVVAMMAFTRDDRTLFGETPALVAERLAELDVDVWGVNCSGGPAQVLRLVTLMREACAEEALIAAVPNAGWPEQTANGRVMYPAQPTYFAE
ncbi:MAG TPA: homocysteine S-methyltransferase family protein, partial [Anaerolineae bacterium]|nr:homocysteine S-methyltransferase family protein [Anaerolineae bacterium]